MTVPVGCRWGAGEGGDWRGKLRYLREHEAEAGAAALLQLAGVDLQHLVEDAREDLGWHAHARVDHLLQRGEGVGRGCGLGEPRRKER